MALPVIIAAALSAGIAAGPASAHSGPDKQSGPDNICTTFTYNGTHQCLNLWNNNQSDGAPIKYYHFGGNNLENKWEIEFYRYVVGTNCTSNCWPFTPGSGYNATYNGDPVEVYMYWDDHNYCMDQGAYNPQSDSGNLEIQGCIGSDDQLFVYTAYDFQVAVGATNVGYAYGYRNHPVWIASVGGNWGDSKQAVLSNSNAGPLGLYTAGKKI